jgi:hypothetical protein
MSAGPVGDGVERRKDMMGSFVVRRCSGVLFVSWAAERCRSSQAVRLAGGSAKGAGQAI